MLNLYAIRRIDLDIQQLLAERNEQEDAIIELVNKRDVLLEQVLVQVEQNPDLAKSQDWLVLCEETQQLLRLLQFEHDELKESLQRFRHSNKSLQVYKKFS